MANWNYFYEALIFWWLGKVYIREACPMKVGPPEKPSDC